MLIDFFLHLKSRHLAVSTKEFLTLLEALQERVCGNSLDEFYYLSRACLIKDEASYDKFDRAFGEYFKGVTRIPGLEADIPEDWLRLLMKRPLAAAGAALGLGVVEAGSAYGADSRPLAAGPAQHTLPLSPPLESIRQWPDQSPL